MNGRSRIGFWIWPLIIVVIVGGVATVLFSTSIAAKKNAELKKSAMALAVEVEDFHDEIMELNPSATSKELLQIELQRLKQKAEHSADSLRQLQRQADQIEGRNTALLQESIEAAIVYVNGCAKMANQAVSLATLKTAAEDFFRAYETAKSSLGAAGSPSRSEANDAIERIAKLVVNYSKKSVPTRVVVATTPAVYYPSWAESSQDRQYYSGIEQIAQEIQESRRYLGSKSGIDWSQGKAGNWSYFNQTWIKNILTRVISQKYDQLRTLQNLERYGEHSALTEIVREMLQNAISGLEALRNDADYNRFKAYNNRNDQLARVLSSRYGIKAFGR